MVQVVGANTKERTLEIRPGNVREVTVKDGLVLVPLVVADDRGTDQLATNIYDLHRLGFSWKGIRAYFGFMIPRAWCLSKVLAYVRERGRARVVYDDPQSPKMHGWVGRKWHYEYTPVIAEERAYGRRPRRDVVAG
jgi:hypothetical protein